MILHFETDAVEVDDEDGDVLIIGFYTEDNYLMIQTAYQFDEQDVKLGMDTYHIERDDQSYGGYGGVAKIILQRAHIEVALDEVGKKNLQCDGLKIDFDTDEETYQQLEEKLKEIFLNVLQIQ